MALLTLAAFSAVAGVLILWTFKLTSNQRALKATRRRLRAHLLAMRLFADDPVLILRSQARLLAWNARYMALLLPPFLAIAIPLFFAWDHLDAVWGRAPLAPGDTTVVTARLRGDVSPAQLTTPPWLAVETPPVRARAEHEVSWRVRVRKAGSGEMRVRAGTESAGKWIEARPGLHYLPERTAPAGGRIEWVEVRYPRAHLSLLGVSANWVVWFCLISTLAALALRGRLRVTF
jgi:hypothetical protein